MHKPRTVEIVCGGLIALSGLYYLLSTPLTPSLIGTHPVLLELLRGSTSAMVAAGAFARIGHGSVPIAILAGVAGVALTDPLYWWAGRLWGREAAHAVAGRGPRAVRTLNRVERLAERFGSLAIVVSYFLPVPNSLVYAAAGWTGMGLARFIALDLIAASLWVGVAVGLGYAIGQSAVDVAKSISHYSLYASIGLVVAIFVYQFWRARRDAAAEPLVP
jgi:membrane protein DedA with SNARE-associated domain